MASKSPLSVDTSKKRGGRRRAPFYFVRMHAPNIQNVFPPHFSSLSLSYLLGVVTSPQETNKAIPTSIVRWR